MSTKDFITKDTSLADFKRLMALGNEEAWNIVDKILCEYRYEVTEALIDSDLRGEAIVKAYLERDASLDNLVFWIMRKNENKDI